MSNKKQEKLPANIDGCKGKLTEKSIQLIDVSKLKASCCSLEVWDDRVEKIKGFKEAESFSKIMRILANPIRLKIIAILLESDCACNCVFEYVLDIHQTLISHHLRILRDSGMVTYRKDGLWKYYSITEEFRPFLNNFRESKTVKSLSVDVELIGPFAQAWRDVFQQNFSCAASIQTLPGEESFICIRYRAGALNSRKAQISPFLPRIVP